MRQGKILSIQTKLSINFYFPQYREQLKRERRAASATNQAVFDTDGEEEEEPADKQGKLRNVYGWLNVAVVGTYRCYLQVL